MPVLLSLSRYTMCPWRCAEIIRPPSAKQSLNEDGRSALGLSIPSRVDASGKVRCAEFSYLLFLQLMRSLIHRPVFCLSAMPCGTFPASPPKLQPRNPRFEARLDLDLLL